MPAWGRGEGGGIGVGVGVGSIPGDEIYAFLRLLLSSGPNRTDLDGKRRRRRRRRRRKNSWGKKKNFALSFSLSLRHVVTWRTDKLVWSVWRLVVPNLLPTPASLAYTPPAGFLLLLPLPKRFPPPW
jgi:hypothetical protein